MLRADPSTQSAARPWPRPWRSMEPSQRSVSTCHCSSVMKDARPWPSVEIPKGEVFILGIFSFLVMPFQRIVEKLIFKTWSYTRL